MNTLAEQAGQPGQKTLKIKGDTLFLLFLLRHNPSSVYMGCCSMLLLGFCVNLEKKFFESKHPLLW